MDKYIVKPPWWVNKQQLIALKGKNEKGEWNHQAVVNDAYKIKFFDQIMQEVYKQGKNSGQSDTIKNQNNITLDSQTSAAAQSNF